MDMQARQVVENEPTLAARARDRVSNVSLMLSLVATVLFGIMLWVKH